MAAGVDFYEHLLQLLEQIPSGRVSTYTAIAEALGDPVASRAVSEAMERERFSELRDKAVKSPPSSQEAFSDFVSERPLEQLAKYQVEQAGKVILEDGPENPDRVAGVDVSYQGDVAASACVVMDGDLKIIELASTVIPVAFPYIPGYLMFREAPAIEAVAEHVSGFDLLMVNGHGVAHPRGCGLASYVGLRLGVPTIGVARSLLVGRLRGEGEVVHDGTVVAAEIRRAGHRPFYVSPGHLISLSSSVDFVRRMGGEGPFPEPLRLAHIEARRLMREL